MMGQDIYGRIELEPIFDCGMEYLTVEFKIGADMKYVLKDVFEFAKNMEVNAEHAYGKKLKFVHMAGAFEPISQKLAEFIVRWVTENGDRYIQYSYQSYGYGYGNSYVKLRKIPLGGADLEQLLTIVEERPVTANVNGTGERLWSVTKDKLVRKMQITGKKEGIEIDAEPLFGYYGAYNALTFKDGLIYIEKKEGLMPVQDF